MTKDELAKKKGAKVKATNQTAAESLITTKTEVNDEEKAKTEVKIDAKPETKLNENAKPEKEVKDEVEAKSEEIEIKPSVRDAKRNESSEKKSSTASEKKDIPKPGRPKGKPSTKISLNVPDEYLEIVNIASGINFKGNTSSYIVSLIEKDIKANGKVYQQIKELTRT